jgi:SNF2 family DNA or RNA helicase
MNARDALSAKSISSSSPLFGHQKLSVAKHAKTPVIFDNSDPGTGKTRVQIEVFAARRRKKGKAALVVCTKSLIDSAWKDDFNKFAFDMHVVTAYAENREEAFAIDADVYVTNHDAVKWLAKKPASFFKRFDTLIVDESTAFKHHTSQRSKAIAKIAKYFVYRTCMTGTPIANGVCDVWHQVMILDDGKRLGNLFTKFQQAACNYVKGNKEEGGDERYGKWVDRPGIENVVGELLKDIIIRHKFEDCVDIPPNHRYAIKINLSKKHQALYNKMAFDKFLELKGKPINAVNGGALYQKLLQVASGAVYSTPGDWETVDTERYELVLDLVEERPQTIVFFSWEHQRDKLVEEAERRGITYAIYDGSVTNTNKRNEIVKSFQRGELRTIFAHPKSAGHGLTLTKGTATIWASPTYNLEYFLQGLKRVHRIGQTEKTETIVIVANDTVDEQVWEVCQGKDARQKDFLTVLEQQMRGV